MKDLNKFLGVMFGWAIWDALWSTTEFLKPWQFTPITDFKWRAKFRTGPWDYTDDTAQALCLAQSLIDCNWFNIEDQLDKFLKWLEEWYMSSQPRAFWIWLQTGERIYKYKQYKEWKIKDKPREEDLSWKKKDWNWALMKIGPIPLFYHDNAEETLYYAWESVKAIHNTDLCISCAEYFVWLVWWALNWVDKKTLQKFDYSPIPDYRKTHTIHKKLLPVTRRSYNWKTEKQLSDNIYWYVVDSLEIALWWFFKFDSFEEWMIHIVNLWGDADTNACIYGYLAWAYYWYDTIPERRRENISRKRLITEITEKLYNH